MRMPPVTLKGQKINNNKNQCTVKHIKISGSPAKQGKYNQRNFPTQSCQHKPATIKKLQLS